MPTISRPDGAELHYDVVGDGVPLVLVHGSWVDSAHWNEVVPALSERFRVVTYDRRGHGASGGAPRDGTIHDDVGDLAAIIEQLGLAPAHVCAFSYGANIVLRLAAQHPELVRRIAVHEPGLFGLLDRQARHADSHDDVTTLLEAIRDVLASGADARGAELFITSIDGPDGWEELPAESQQYLIAHAPTFLGELQDPDSFAIETDALAAIGTPILLTGGGASPRMFAAVLECLEEHLPGAERHTLSDADHVPHLTHPEDYVELVAGFLDRDG